MLPLGLLSFWYDALNFQLSDFLRFFVLCFTRSMVILLQDDLVDSCKAGDDVVSLLASISRTGSIELHACRALL